MTPTERAVLETLLVSHSKSPSLLSSLARYGFVRIDDLPKSIVGETRATNFKISGGKLIDGRDTSAAAVFGKCVLSHACSIDIL